MEITSNNIHLLPLDPKAVDAKPVEAGRKPARDRGGGGGVKPRGDRGAGRTEGRNMCYEEKDSLEIMPISKGFVFI